MKEKPEQISCSDLSAGKDGPMPDQVEEQGQRMPSLVCLTLRRSGSDEDDLRKVEVLYDCLQAFPGPDYYEFVVEHEEWRVRLVPENNRLHSTKELHIRLEALLGPGMVHVARLEESRDLSA